MTIYCRDTPPQGGTIEFVSALPERPTPAVLTGRVVAQSPMLESTTGRSVEVDVESADAETTRLLSAEGTVDAPLTLDQIPR